jgi:hypothetical protein
MNLQPKITVELERDEALVLYEYLRRCDDEGIYKFVHDAEQQVIWKLECALQPNFDEICDPAYMKIVASARSAVHERLD